MLGYIGRYVVGMSDFPYYEDRALATYFLVVDNFHFRPDRVGIEPGIVGSQM